MGEDERGASLLFKRVRAAALEAIAPTRCAGCERPGYLICPVCLGRMVPIDPVHACTRCGAPFGDVLCTECGVPARDGAMGGAAAGGCAAGDGVAGGAVASDCVVGDGALGNDAVGEGRGPQAAAGSLVRGRGEGRCLAATVFEGPVPRIIRAYKDAGEQRLAEPIAELMLDAAEHAEDVARERYGGLIAQADAVTFVPVTAAAYARRGFDHMERIAAAFSRLSGVPLVDALVKYGSADQRALDRAERRAQARGAYEVVEPVAGMRLLLLDDVITTGATVRAARAALLRAGAARVDALAFARVW